MTKANRANLEMALIKQAQNGDNHAFARLIQPYQAKLNAKITHYFGETPYLDDIMQESWLQAYLHLAEFHGKGRFYAWLYRLVFNTAKNHLAQQHWHEQQLILFSNAYRLLTSATPSPEHTLYCQERGHALAQSWQQLPKALRTALALRIVHGLNYQAIAHTLHCRLGTVRSRLGRAKLLINNK